jgi:hypothetical protein
VTLNLWLNLNNHLFLSTFFDGGDMGTLNHWLDLNHHLSFFDDGNMGILND